MCYNCTMRIYNLLKTNAEFYKIFRNNFTYHSSSIEGSTITKEEHTKLSMLNNKANVNDIDFIIKEKINDAIENLNCIKLFDYMFSNYDEALSHEIIKKYQYILKEKSLLHLNVPNECGKYRSTYVKVGALEGTPPYLIHEQMDSLLKDFSIRKIFLLDDIAEFHVRYETIHPFRDGNGRTGRIIMLKQCLLYNITPFDIDSSTRNEYIDTISLTQQTYDYSKMQNYFTKRQKDFLIKYKEYINSVQVDNHPNENLIINFLTKNGISSKKQICNSVKLSERLIK
ncbi:hypothetical protein FACS189459_7330 [Bacilli bacterium]|nr:hypothetical protein FACS189459_7330 [Bacilli bacterium]